MTPEQVIRALDAQLSAHGEDIILRRMVKRDGAVVAAEVACRALARSLSGDAIVGAQNQETMRVVISPTQVLAASWPGEDENEVSGTSIPAFLPRPTDVVIVRGRKMQVKVPGAVYLANTWVRSSMTVAG